MTLLILFGLLIIFYALAEICDKYFVESLEMITERLKISPDVAGATFMAVGSSAPEFFTAVIALSKVGAESIGAGTIVGSAIFNILVIVGASAVVSTAFLSWKPVVRDIGFYILSLLVLLFTFSDGVITLSETFWYIGLYLIYLIVLKYWNRWVPHQAVEKKTLPQKKSSFTLNKPRLLRVLDQFISFFFPNLKKNPQRFGITFVVSVLLIAVLSWFMVELAVHLAQVWNISQAIIALTVLAAGTSVPDLLSSIFASKRGSGDMAISNAVGSNTFDILIGLGLPWCVYTWWKGSPVTVGTESLMSSMILLFATVIVLFFLIIAQQYQLRKSAGWTLILLYVAYLIFTVFQVLS